MGPSTCNIKVMTSDLTEILPSLTFPEFLAWDDGAWRDFELVNGLPTPIPDPNARHDDVVDWLCDVLVSYCQRSVGWAMPTLQLEW